MIGLMVVMLMVFHTCSELVLWGVGPILRNESGIQGQNYVALLQGVVLCRIASRTSKCKQITTAGFAVKAHGHCKHICGLMVTKSDFRFRGPQSLPRGENMNLLFVWCGGPSVKKQWKERQDV